jgi:hypothetical protein
VIDNATRDAGGAWDRATGRDVATEDRAMRFFERVLRGVARRAFLGFLAPVFLLTSRSRPRV